MAESESAPKLGDLFVGLVDFFSIILPGAIITFVVLAASSLKVKLEPLAGASLWAVFLSISYVLGHVISALSGLLLDEVYDTAYKIDAHHKKYARGRDRAKAALLTYLKQGFTAHDNAMEWADVIVRTRNGAAASEVDRLEADSKFFRSLAMVVTLGWPTFLAINTYLPQADIWTWFKRWAWAAAPVLVIVALKLFVANRNKKYKDETDQAQTAKQKIAANERLHAACRPAAYLAVTIWVGTLLYSAHDRYQLTRLAVFGLAFLGLFSAWRYMERRLKRTTLAYNYVVALLLQGDATGKDSKAAGGVENS